MRKWQQCLSVVSIFAFLAVAAGQDAVNNTTTNQSNPQNGSTNQAPDASLPSPYPSSTTNSLTNLFNVAPVQQPLLGPGTVGSDQLTSPLMGTSVFGAPPGAVIGAVAPGPGIPIWGPIGLHPGLFYSFVYGNGIESQPGQQSKTVVNTMSAGLLFDLGSHWKLDYIPSYAIYSDPAFRNTLAHSLILSGGTTYEDWAFNFAQTYARSDSPLIETGAQTAQEAYGTTIGAVHQMSSKLSLQLGASQNFRFADQFDNVRSWTGSSGLNYQFIPQLGMGIALSGGYNDLNTGSSMPFESLQGTMNFHPDKKLTLTLSGGAEDMQFVHPSAPPLITPIFSASLAYQLFRGTAIALSGSRSVTPSYFGNQVEVVTAVGGSIQQRLSRKLSLAVNAGYSSQPLTSIVPAPPPKFFLGAPPTTSLVVDQKNDATSFGVSLSYAVVERGSMSVFYSVNENSSSQSNYKYSSSQIGFSLSYSIK